MRQDGGNDMSLNWVKEKCYETKRLELDELGKRRIRIPKIYGWYFVMRIQEIEYVGGSEIETMRKRDRDRHVETHN